jgi:hypothetical protein
LSDAAAFLRRKPRTPSPAVAEPPVEVHAK